jgi:hypothetical protein
MTYDLDGVNDYGWEGKADLKRNGRNNAAKFLRQSTVFQKEKS